MKVKDLVDKLMEFDPELEIYVSNGEDEIGPVFAPAELVDTASQVVYVENETDKPWTAWKPSVIQVVRIRRYW